MYKVLWLLKPEPGVTREEFRDWYENSHAPLAQRYFGHLLIEYRRNYVDEVVGAVPSDYVAGVESMPRDLAAKQARGFEFAVIAEWVMADRTAFDDIMSIFADPEIGPIFRKDSMGTMSPDTLLIHVAQYETRRADPERASKNNAGAVPNGGEARFGRD